MDASAFVLLVAAGVVAGALGSAGGITSLVSFPALLLVGLSPRDANVVNLVAVVACWPGSALASRRELTGTGRWLTRALPVAGGGALVGSVLLLTTPSRAFDRLAPFLVLLGSAALLVQPWLTRRQDRAGVGTPSPAPALAGIGAISVYSGYFGAGSGVLLLALLLAVHDRRLPVANAEKNMLIGASGVASAALLLAADVVRWDAVLPLAIGELVGSLLGPAVARAVPAPAVRVAVAALGVVLAVELLVGLR